MAPLQKRVLYEFVATIVTAAVVLPIIFFAEYSAALLLLIVLVFILAHWIPGYLTRPRLDQPIIMDERDKVILSKVPRYQRFGIMLAVIVWMGVTAYSSDSRDQVTINGASFLWLAGSVVIADNVFSVIGTMIEYWRTK